MNSTKIKILYLYSEVMGYTISILQSIKNNYSADIHVVHWDHKKVSGYSLPVLEGISFYNRSELNFKTLKLLAEEVEPDLVYVSGWMDKDYLKLCLQLKGKNIPIVAGLDTQWQNSLKQKISALFSDFFHKRYFSYMWVAGRNQYEYAKRLGFKNDEIIFDVYSADTFSFNTKYHENKSEKSKKYPHVFLYVGRFNKRKGIDLLIQAFKNTFDHINHDWKLVLIGNGSIEATHESIEVKDFMQPGELVNEIKNSGVFCLPSNFEAWGVVVHEFAAAGLPLLTSDVCGASTEFLKTGYNGFTFKSSNLKDLTLKMIRMIRMSDEQLSMMGNRSYELSKHISPETSAANLMSILEIE